MREPNKTPIQRRVHEWLSFEEKYNLRTETYLWLGVRQGAKKSSGESKGTKTESLCPDKEDVAARS